MIIEGKGDREIIEVLCPECGRSSDGIAWVEYYFFQKRIECPYCRYSGDLPPIRLIEEGYSGPDIDIEANKNLFNMARDEYKTVCKECGNVTLNGGDEFLASCPKCGSNNVTHSFREGNAAMLMWIMKNRGLV